MTPTLDTHGYRIQDGELPHGGELITRVPVRVLHIMVRQRHPEAAYALAELARRGTPGLPGMEISFHAIDRASQGCINIWKRTRRNQNEGLHAWLTRVSTDAIGKGKKIGDKWHYMGMKFIFATDGVWPVLTTIMRDETAIGKPIRKHKRERFLDDREDWG